MSALAKVLAALGGAPWRRRGSASKNVPPTSAPAPEPHDGSADPPILLDSTAFPHLLDSIIVSSTPADLLSLRQTSRAAHDVSDAVLFAHVAVVAADYPIVEYWAPDLRTRLPLQPRLDASNPHHADKLAHVRVLDIYPAGARGSGPAATPAVLRAQWARAEGWPAAILPMAAADTDRVIDSNDTTSNNNNNNDTNATNPPAGSSTGPTSDGPSPDLGPNPHLMLRRADASLPHPPARTLVDYIDLTSQGPPDTGFIHSSGACSAYVLHLSFAQGGNSYPRGLMLRGARRSHGVQSVTLVLSPYEADETANGIAELETPDRTDRFDVLLPFMHSLVPWLAGGASLTIVGAERCRAMYLGVDEGARVEERRRRRRRRLRAYLGGGEGEVEEGDGASISPALQSALRSRIYEISVADATFGRSPDENWHWDRGEVARAHEVAETTRVLTFDEWRGGQDPLVAEWRPVQPV